MCCRISIPPFPMFCIDRALQSCNKAPSISGFWLKLNSNNESENSRFVPKIEFNKKLERQNSSLL